LHLILSEVYLACVQHVGIKGCNGAQPAAGGFPQQPDTKHTVV